MFKGKFGIKKSKMTTRLTYSGAPKPSSYIIVTSQCQLIQNNAVLFGAIGLWSVKPNANIGGAKTGGIK